MTPTYPSFDILAKYVPSLHIHGVRCHDLSNTDCHPSYRLPSMLKIGHGPFFVTNNVASRERPFVLHTVGSNECRWEVMFTTTSAISVSLSVETKFCHASLFVSFGRIYNIHHALSMVISHIARSMLILSCIVIHSEMDGYSSSLQSVSFGININHHA